MVAVIFAVLYAVFICAAMIILIGWSRKDGKDRKQEKSKYRRWKIPFIYVPTFLAAMFILNIWKMGLLRAIEWLIAFGFSFALTISLYYLLMNFFLKGLRRFWDARTCAILWFVPTFLVTVSGGFPIFTPKWVICLKTTVLWIVAVIWFAGFVAVWIWKLREDHVFRREIMEDASVITDPEILAIWHEELKKAGADANVKYVDPTEKAPMFTLHKKIWGWMQPVENHGKVPSQSDNSLMRSPHVKTPLTIHASGIILDVRIILPEKDYSREDLALILRHELVHILRDDRDKKRLLVFCKALCWFDPLMWIAMRRSAEDLELSCDEAVLMDEDEQTRRKYAELILRTAGDERGFTTCLSASAESLRYRLKSIVKPRNRKNGMWLMVPLLFLLYLGYGQVALGFDTTTGAQVVFANEDLAEYEIATVHLSGEGEGYYECISPDAMNHYLSGLTVSSLGGNYRAVGDLEMIVVYNGPEGSFGVSVCGRFIEIIPMYEGTELDEDYNERYYLHDDLDWDYIRSLLN